MIRNERLRLPEEDGYKKGGRVRVSLEITAKVKRKKGKKAKKKGRKATGKRARGGEAMKYVPLGGALPTTGMSSTVFGAPQPPSYFRAVLPQQEFANIPDVLKGLKEGQKTIMKELEKRKAQVEADKVFAQSLSKTKEEPSPVPSGSVTPTMNWRVSPPPLMRPIATMMSSPLGKLDPFKLQRQDSITPEIMTPTMSAFAPIRAIPTSYTGALSSREAMSAEPYRGADENIPSQQAVSGQEMKPVDANVDASQPSAYVPLGASQPESVGDSAERASAVASTDYFKSSSGKIIKKPEVESRSVSAPVKAYTIPGTKTMVIPRPRISKEEKEAFLKERAEVKRSAAFGVFAEQTQRVIGEQAAKKQAAKKEAATEQRRPIVNPSPALRAAIKKLRDRKAKEAQEAQGGQ